MNVLLTTSAAPSQTPFSTNEKRPPVGVGYLISVLRDSGHNVSFIDNYLSPSNFLETDYVQRHQIDCVGIYTNTICYRDSLRMFYRLEEMRQLGLWHGKIVVGGPHASVSPDTIPPFVDHIVIGEGEYALRDILAGKITERIVQYPSIENLDELPMPAWDYFAEMPYDWGGDWLPDAPVFTMNTSRGCPFDCTFCSVGSIWGRRYTFFSAERVVADIEYVVKHYGAKGIYFREDNFTLNKNRLYEFCNLMIAKSINIPWVCETRASSLDRETVELMARAGAKGAYIGVESGSQRLLDFMHKAIKLEDVHRAFQLCQEFRINTAASIIVGVPTETQQDLQMTRELLKDIKPTVTWFNVFVGIPKSSLYRYVLDNKLYEYIDDRGLVYLKGHNERVSAWYGQAWDAEIPIKIQNHTIITPKISVIMSVYNGGKYLFEAIKSIQNQTFNNFEFLIVNDASTDNTAQILQQIDDPRIRVFTNQQNLGLTRSLNKVLRHCRGDFIARMDADDVSHPFRMEKQVSFLESHQNYALVGSAYYVINETGKTISRVNVLTESQQIKAGLEKQNWFGHGSVMMRKSVLKMVDGYDEEFRYAQDYDLWLRLSEHYELANIEEPLYFWRCTSQAVSHDKAREQQFFAELAKKNALIRKQQSEDNLEQQRTEYSPLVSVIVPTYNRPTMLKDAIQSVLDQTFQYFEIIVINDAGQDVSSIIAGFNSQKILYLYHETNKGLAAARNTGIRAARGKYIAYLDDDDIYYPNHLNTLISFLQSTGGKIAYTDAYRVRKEFIDGHYKTVSKDIPYSFDFDYDRIQYENFIPVICIVHARKCCDVVGMFDESFVCLEDWELWIRMSGRFLMNHLKVLTCEFSYRNDRSNMVSGSAYKFAYMVDKIYTKHFNNIGNDIRIIRESHKNLILSSMINDKLQCAVLQLYYIDDNNCFSESSSIIKHIPISQDFIDVVIHVPFVKNLTSIRLDPHFDSVILEIESLKIEVDDKSINLTNICKISSNAVLTEDTRRYFDNNDPKIIFSNFNVCVNGHFDLIIKAKYVAVGKNADSIQQSKLKLNKILNTKLGELVTKSGDFEFKNYHFNYIYTFCSRTYDIIIPIYNAYDYTVNCIRHVIKYTEPRHNIYLLDDASTDPRIRPMLEDFAAKHDHIHYLNTPCNLGFVQNMNRGFSISRNDVVILNSDTQVTKGWLERMDRCLVLHPNTAVVSPFSNNATILSVPLMNKKNILPEGYTPDSMSDLVASHSSHLYPKIPTAVGFCMIMSRRSLNSLGGFDTIFGKGYGEECDYCMRVWEAGMEVRCCDDAYVHHYGEASFSKVEKISEDRIRNRELLKNRWPEYEPKVYSYCLQNPLMETQEKLYHALHTNINEQRPHILQVIHSIFAKGGTELHTLSVVTRLAEHFRTTIVLPQGIQNWLDIEAEPINEFLRVALLNDKIVEGNEHFCGYSGELYDARVEHKFAQFVQGGDYRIVHFQHMIKWNSLLLPFIAKALGKKVVISLHDYFLLCPEYNLVLPDHTKCDKAYALEFDEGCFRCLGEKRYAADPSTVVQLHEYLAERHTIVGLMLQQADVVVAPSEFVKRQFLRAFDVSIAEKIRIIPHGVSVSTKSVRPKRIEILRVAFLGNLTAQKGADCLLNAAELLRGKNVQFHVFGGINDDTLAARAHQDQIILHGSYQVNELPALLGAVDIVLIPSVWHETFCLTLSEAQAMGIPVIAADVGALSERISDGITGFLFRPSDPAHLAERLCEIALDRNSLVPVIESLRSLRFKSDKENAEEYANLYRELLMN